MVHDVCCLVYQQIGDDCNLVELREFIREFDLRHDGQPIKTAGRGNGVAVVRERVRASLLELIQGSFIIDSRIIALKYFSSGTTICKTPIAAPERDSMFASKVESLLLNWCSFRALSACSCYRKSG